MKKQSEVDYFINKNAKKFLQEQFKLYIHDYLWEGGAKEWTTERVNQLQIYKDIAYKIIDFISQFEDELVKIWNKPKFALNSNYVITLDKIAEKDKSLKLIEKILKHKNFEEQAKEWGELGIIQNTKIKNQNDNPKFKLDLFENTLQGKKIKKEYEHLPIDTKYFKDLELEILSLFDDLDKSLDGWLIKSENYQALNTILPKFKEKVQTIYIDPPFNKEQDADYFYSVKYKDSSWTTLLENRLRLARELLNEKGSIFVRCDYNGNWIVRPLMNEIFGEENFRNEIVVNRTLGKKKIGESFAISKDSLFLYSKSLKMILKEIERPLERASFITFLIKNLEREDRFEEELKEKIRNTLLEILWVPLDHRPGERTTASERIVFGKKFYPPRGRHWIKSQEKLNQLLKEEKVRLRCSNCGYIHNSGEWQKCPTCGKNEPVIEIFLTSEPISELWLDIPGYTQTWNFPTENSEILLKRVIESTSNEGDLVMDFFLGSGTTTAVAHKLKRKWIGVEMGEHFYTVVLPRMKKVLAYDKSGISKEVKEYQGGGFFKYYELEQYEEALANCKYKDGDLFTVPGRNPYQEYVLLKDEKMLKALEIDYENNKVKVDLSKIYPNIDIAETLSNLTGKWIKKIREGEVEFEDGIKINTKDLDYKLIKPLIWWE